MLSFSVVYIFRGNSLSKDGIQTLLNFFLFNQFMYGPSFFICFLVTILVFIHRYIYYIMMMVKCGTGQSSGSRFRRIRGSTAVRFLYAKAFFVCCIDIFIPKITFNFAVSLTSRSSSLSAGRNSSK